MASKVQLHTNPSLRCGHCNNCFISEAALVKHLQLHGTSLPMLTFGIGAFSSNIPANQTAFGINGTIGGPNVPTYVVNGTAGRGMVDNVGMIAFGA
ncbi:hypothetical protein IscW_ISCW013669 [Ixodes scapularis]|uniref:C2H2-type domain-containing protein n=1 Tax=Ixodes scapularis TaxID=6945 RepID=B7QGY7_IXOSC|nr:hypothetical protein IscW_ISCW013669 [Ixodes scapularis]|eukprot:XP_002414444.1 hypothetical protein IscW_ISCW013669 [Ixodes scapularis]